MDISSSLFYFIVIIALLSLVADHIHTTHRKSQNKKQETFITYKEPMANYCKPKMVISEKRIKNPFNTCQPAVEEQKKIRIENIVKNSKYKQLPGNSQTSLEFHTL